VKSIGREKALATTPERFVICLVKNGEDGELQLLNRRQFSSDFRRDRLKRLLSTKAIACQTVTNRPVSRLSGYQKTEGI
jgi:hypothetical protein